MPQSALFAWLHIPTGGKGYLPHVHGYTFQQVKERGGSSMPGTEQCNGTQHLGFSLVTHYSVTLAST